MDNKNNKLEFKDLGEIRKWANTTNILNVDGIVQVRHFENKLYYYFKLQKDMVYHLEMTSENNIFSGN